MSNTTKQFPEAGSHVNPETGRPYTQNRLILDCLKESRGQWVSVIQLWDASGSLAVHSRIDDLRDHGQKIDQQSYWRMNTKGRRVCCSAYRWTGEDYPYVEFSKAAKKRKAFEESQAQAEQPPLDEIDGQPVLDNVPANALSVEAEFQGLPDSDADPVAVAAAEAQRQLEA